MIEKIEVQTENLLRKNRLGTGIPKSKGFNNLMALFECSMDEYNNTDSPYSIDYFNEIYEDNLFSANENFLSDCDLELLSENDSNKNVTKKEDNMFTETLFQNSKQ